jgi:plasmid stabilization system protein ParE
VTRVVWSAQAVRDIESIRGFIAQDSAAYADFEAHRIVAAVERLQAFPESGRQVPERRDPTLREVIAAPYRIVYRLREGAAEIVTVFRGSCRLPDFVQ